MIRFIAVLCLIALATGVAVGSPLRVAVKIAEPFVVETDDGGFEGVSVALWQEVARSLDIAFEFEAAELDDMLDGVADGTYDVGVGAITITPAREDALDMSHGYYMDGLGIAVPARAGSAPWLRAIAGIFTPAFLSATGALALLLFGVGVVVWMVERKGNAEQFHPRPRGVADGFWFAAVTMTTVGYGDKAPATPLGKLVSLVWMFASIIVISAFTGAIASSLTAAQIDSGVKGPEDLDRSRIGVVSGAATVSTLSARGVTPKQFESLDAGLAALVDGNLDAFVHDAAILRYHVNSGFGRDVRMLESKFNLGSYAFALPQGSDLVEPINRAILRVTHSPEWNRRVQEALSGQ